MESKLFQLQILNRGERTMGYRGCCGLGTDPNAPDGENCMDCGKKLWMFNRRHEALGVDGPLCTKCVTSRSQGILNDDDLTEISDDEVLSSIASSRSPSREQLSPAPNTPLVNSCGGASGSKAPARSVTPEPPPLQRATSSTQPSMPSLSLATDTIQEEEAPKRIEISSPNETSSSIEVKENDITSLLMEFVEQLMDLLGGPLGRYGGPVVLLCVISFYFTGISFADVFYFIVGYAFLFHQTYYTL